MKLSDHVSFFSLKLFSSSLIISSNSRDVNGSHASHGLKTSSQKNPPHRFFCWPYAAAVAAAAAAAAAAASGSLILGSNLVSKNWWE